MTHIIRITGEWPNIRRMDSEVKPIIEKIKEYGRHQSVTVYGETTNGIIFTAVLNNAIINIKDELLSINDENENHIDLDINQIDFVYEDNTEIGAYPAHISIHLL